MSEMNEKVSLEMGVKCSVSFNIWVMVIIQVMYKNNIRVVRIRYHPFKGSPKEQKGRYYE